MSSLPYNDRVIEIYEDAAFQAEGDLHVLAVLVVFFEPENKYSEVKKDFDNGTNIDGYLEVFERINAMKTREVRAFMAAYAEQIDGSVARLREAVVDSFKKVLPRFADVECEPKVKRQKKKEQRSLF